MKLFKYSSTQADAAKSGLNVQEKTDWKRAVLTEPTRFVHKSNLSPETVKNKGIDPMYAKDYFVDGNGEQIGSGKMIFAFPEGGGGKVLQLMMGVLKYSYVFEAEAGIEFFCSGGKLAKQKEVAFPYTVEPEDIVGPPSMLKKLGKLSQVESFDVK